MTNEDKLTDAEYAALANFRHVLRQFQAFSEVRVADFRLTPQQHQALLAIRAAPLSGVSIGYLANWLVIKSHSASGLVVRLEAMGLIVRHASPVDGRQSLVDLTPKAKSLLEELSVIHRDEIVRLRPLLASLLDAIV